MKERGKGGKRSSRFSHKGRELVSVPLKKRVERKKKGTTQKKKNACMLKISKYSLRSVSMSACRQNREKRGKRYNWKESENERGQSPSIEEGSTTHKWKRVPLILYEKEDVGENVS